MEILAVAAIAAGAAVSISTFYSKVSKSGGQNDDLSDLSQLRNEIRLRLDCPKTLSEDPSSCGGDLALWSKTASFISAPVGTTYQKRESHEVKALCAPSGSMKRITIEYRKVGTTTWTDLFPQIPIMCKSDKFPAFDGMTILNGGRRQADGKIVLIIRPLYGTGYRLLRLSTSFGPDASFGASGWVTGNSSHTPTALEIQSDGKILVAGVSGPFPASSTAPFVSRFNTDGSPDSTFGTAGSAVLNSTLSGFTGAASVAKILRRADGRLLMLGTVYGPDSLNDILAFQLQSNGALDTTFATTGMTRYDYPSSHSVGPITAAFDASERAFALFRTPGMGPVMAYRILANGTPDPAFNGGSSPMPIVYQPYPKQIHLLSSGMLLFHSSEISAAFTLWRFTPDGSPDPSYGTGGVAGISALTGQGLEMLVQPDEKAVLVGLDMPAGITTRRFALARFNANGSADTTFDGDGLALGPATPGPAYADIGYASVLTLDGKIFTTAHKYEISDIRSQVFVFNSDGSPASP